MCALLPSLQCLDLESRCSGLRPRPRRDFGVTRPRRDRDEMETLKNVSRNVSMSRDTLLLSILSAMFLVASAKRHFRFPVTSIIVNAANTSVLI